MSVKELKQLGHDYLGEDVWPVGHMNFWGAYVKALEWTTYSTSHEKEVKCLRDVSVTFGEYFGIWVLIILLYIKPNLSV